MRRTIVVSSIALVVLVLATPATAGQAPSIKVLTPFHANPLVCDAPLGDVPAGPVDFHFTRPDNRMGPAWATPAGSTTGPWAVAQILYFHADWSTLNESGTGPGEWLFETEGQWPVKTGLLGTMVTCHNSAPYFSEDDGVWYWIDFMVEMLVIPDGK